MEEETERIVERETLIGSSIEIGSIKVSSGKESLKQVSEIALTLFDYVNKTPKQISKYT